MIEELLEVVSLSQQLAGVVRSVKIGPRTAYENDAEHSYQLGLTAWYISEKLHLSLDRGKILQYATVHDLVEVFAGDTDPYTSAAEYKESKIERESAALLKIKESFADFPSLHETIEVYESHQDKESKLVYIVDKLLPVINTQLSHHSYYVDNYVTFEQWQELLNQKIAKVDAEALLGKGFFQELINFFKQQPELFAKTNG